MLDHLPAAANAQARLTPVYETLEGWSESTHGARSWAQLPANAIKYVRRVEELIGAPVALLSTSPDRDDTIMVQRSFYCRNPSGLRIASAATATSPVSAFMRAQGRNVHGLASIALVRLGRDHSPPRMRQHAGGGDTA